MKKIAFTYEDIEDLAAHSTINVPIEDAGGAEVIESGWDWDYEALLRLLEGDKIVDEDTEYRYDGPHMAFCEAGKEGNCEACQDDTFPEQATHIVTITWPDEAAKVNPNPQNLCAHAASMVAEAYIGFGWALSVDHTVYGREQLQKESTS